MCLYLCVCACTGTRCVSTCVSGVCVNVNDVNAVRVSERDGICGRERGRYVYGVRVRMVEHQKR